MSSLASALPWCLKPRITLALAGFEGGWGHERPCREVTLRTPFWKPDRDLLSAYQAPGTVLAALRGSAQWFLPRACWEGVLTFTQRCSMVEESHSPVGSRAQSWPAPRPVSLESLYAAEDGWFTRSLGSRPLRILSVKTVGYVVMQAARDRSQARDIMSPLSCNSDHHPGLTRSRLVRSLSGSQSSVSKWAFRIQLQGNGK